MTADLARREYLLFARAARAHDRACNLKVCTHKRAPWLDVEAASVRLDLIDADHRPYWIWPIWLTDGDTPCNRLCSPPLYEALCPAHGLRALIDAFDAAEGVAW